MDGFPTLITEAFERLTNSGLIQVTGSLNATEKGGLEFSFSTDVTQPNTESLPPLVEFKVVIPSGFPFKAVDVFPVSPELFGFPHQDAETGKLCLKEESKAPCTAERLKVYVEWSLEWLRDAAQGNLLKNGDPYELPDFSTKRLKERPLLKKDVWFVENGESFTYWRDRVGQTGLVELVQLESPSVLFARLFKSSDGTERKAPVSPTFSVEGDKLSAAWILLPSLAYYRNRPPQTFEEICEKCALLGVNLASILRDLCMGHQNENPYSVLLVGAPIPTAVGAAPTEVHWQPMFLKTVYGEPGDKGRKYGKEKREKLWRARQMESHFSGKDLIPWATSENVSEQRLVSRGGLTDSMRSSKLVFVGCGALGSALSEQFIRAGARDVALIDKDEFEPGNHSRHTLKGRYFGLAKATALRTSLQAGSPHCRLRSHAVSIPSLESKDVMDDLEQADAILDLSANESAFQWLSSFSAQKRKRFVHIFISSKAKFLTMVFSGKGTAARLAFHSFCKLAKKGAIVSLLADEVDEYFREADEEELVIPGPGCWHATFPARWNHIQSLVGVAFDVLEGVLSTPQKSGGMVVLLRRIERGDDPSLRATVIEEIHRGLYR
jgi:molybdopterin/thiamine biosynthesis adenylyltransferase